MQQHIDAFFQYVYVAGPLNYIHRGSFLRAWHGGRLAKTLLGAVVGVTTRFMNLDKADRQSGDVHATFRRWLDDIQREVVLDFRHTTIPKLQILLLLIYDRTMSGDLQTVWYLTALASRNAYGLKLNHPTTAIPFTNQECRRRLMWCIYVLDKFATGVSYPPVCPRDSMHVCLPCDGRSFELEFECQNPSLNDLAQSPSSYTHFPTLGPTAYLIRVLDLRDQVMSFVHVQQSRATDYPSWQTDPEFLRLRKELGSVNDALPPDMEDSERALFIRLNTPESDVYIMVQSWLRTSWCELLRAALQSNLPPTDTTTEDDEAHESRPALDNFSHMCLTEMTKQAAQLNEFWKNMTNVQKLSRRFFVTDWGIAPCVAKNTHALLTSNKLAPDDTDMANLRAALLLNIEILDPLAEISQYVSNG